MEHRSPDPSPSALFEVRQVHLRRGAVQVFEGLTLRLGEERIGLIGHNGAGKTSLMHNKVL